MNLTMAEKSIRILLVLSLLLQTSGLYAQTDQIDMADTFRSEGKIYVVIICAFLVLAIMAVYLFAIDRRVSRLENRSAGKLNLH